MRRDEINKKNLQSIKIKINKKKIRMKFKTNIN